MTDWSKQAEDMIQTWVDAQKKLRDSWMEAMQGVGGSQSNEVMSKVTGAWQESVNRVLEAQSELTRLWVESFSSANDSNNLSDWAKQGQDMMKQWADSQKQLWEGWFEMTKKFDTTNLPGSWNQDAIQNMVNTWQENTQKVLDTQSEWVKRLSSLGQTEKPTKK